MPMIPSMTQYIDALGTSRRKLSVIVMAYSVYPPLELYSPPAGHWELVLCQSCITESCHLCFGACCAQGTDLETPTVEGPIIGQNTRNTCVHSRLCLSQEVHREAKG